MIIEMPYVDEFDSYLDKNVSEAYKDQPLAQDWARIAKVIEELGETIQCLIGYTGQNPRKGVTSSQREMLDEFADTLITCVLGMQHFTKDEWDVETIIQERWSYRRIKAGMV
jgi:hypothetical protein